MKQLFGCNVIKQKSQEGDQSLKRTRQLNPIMKRIFARQNTSGVVAEILGIRPQEPEAEDEDPTYLSLPEIVHLSQERYQFSDRETDTFELSNGVKFEKTFTLKAPNAYSERSNELLTVQISIMEILYDNKICCLVYMRDLTEHLKANSKQQKQEQIHYASNYLSQERKKSELKIESLTKNLLQSKMDLIELETIRRVYNHARSLLLTEKNMHYFMLLTSDTFRASLCFFDAKFTMQKARTACQIDPNLLKISLDASEEGAESQPLGVTSDDMVVQHVLENVIRQALSISEENCPI
mmetsp:Transcript_17622/g.23795  ORF Transcript_17622/g.23795 Transcript_17622/m.23795 type:complete len:296 (-) Transcript_17622:822-1709(-)|eukprot:CAMPEP_0185575338 /NCGR_PEP_ID=MMETSP0434-20130131/6560_1 /TAXON_ID=626734 ORGANISM="Favella taraikaensis, Strain Fe Narragansett Bay" /NCGR_SAMPLE_ID=MMETSP0434 /ASSEMBLY_ACC=CAM_ASM_000379 /LENGTH=295 /DNA_ID=CAMNT_0028192189 /DNA_START=923 /DNA_END=1810 /DNA_ORIENTATION=+